jgi:hypothetical protein
MEQTKPDVERPSVFDPDHTLSYGYFHCTVCESKFYAGGPPIHNDGCKEGWSHKVVYCYGPKETNVWKPQR